MRNEVFISGELNVVSNLPRHYSQAQVWRGRQFNLIESGKIGRFGAS